MDRKAILAAGFIDLTKQEVDLHEQEALLVKAGRIEGFVDRAEIPADAEVLDRSDSYCLPGLIDTAFLPGIIMGADDSPASGYGQMVWNAREAAELWLKSGVATAGTLGAADRLDLDLTRSIRDGYLNGPRLLPALHPLVPIGADQFPASYGVEGVDGPDKARRAARTLIKNGAERIMVYADVPLRFDADPKETSRERLYFSVDELTEIVTQAAQAGCFVHAQAISTRAIENCAQAGVRSIGCAYGLQESQIPLLLEKQVALAPNLALGASVKQFGPSAGFSFDTIQMVSLQRVDPSLLRTAYEKGVEIICGTNAAFLKGNIEMECHLLQEAGLPLEGILRAATWTAAKTLKPYCEWGAFLPNYSADLLFLNGNPLTSLDCLTNPAEVMFGIS